MKTEQTELRKTIGTIIISVFFLSLMTNPAKAATTYVDICPDDTYRASVPLDKRYSYQWQISSKSKTIGESI